MAEDRSPAPDAGQLTVRWADWQKQLVVLVLLVLVPVTLYVLRPVLYSLIYLFLIAFILRYPIKLLHNRLKLSYQVSVLIVYLIFVLLLIGAVFWLLGSLAQTAVVMFQGLQAALNALIPTPQTVTIGPIDLSPIVQPLQKMAAIGGAVKLASSSGALVSQLGSVLGLLAGFLSDLFFVVIILLFFLLELPRTVTAVGRLIPPSARREYAILISHSVELFQSYLIGSLLVVAFYWLVTTLVFTLTGVPNALVSGFVIALPNFIPSLGGLLSALMVFFYTLVVGSETISMNPLLFAFLQMAVFMLIAGVAYYFVDVRVYSRSVNIPVWVLLVGLVVFSAALGLLGVLIAAAVLAILSEVLHFVLKKLRNEDPYPDEPEPPLFASL
ncbi:MAG: AI-2E family transporter [Ardenticatenaceae bacterium]|nr:AI-2E family transporter [Ardenticatenaceae bacterium]